MIINIKCYKFKLMFLCFCVFSCTGKISDRASLINFINDPVNGLKKTNNTGQIKTVLQYKPWQLFPHQFKGDNKINSKRWLDFKNKYYFVFSISANNKELLKQLPMEEYSNLIQVLAFRMDEFVKIIPDQNDPFPPEQCVFDQTYGLSDANQLLIIADKLEIRHAKLLTIVIKEFGLGIGDQNFKIKTSDIDQIPNVDLNN